MGPFPVTNVSFNKVKGQRKGCDDLSRSPRGNLCGRNSPRLGEEYPRVEDHQGLKIQDYWGTRREIRKSCHWRNASRIEEQLSSQGKKWKNQEGMANFLRLFYLSTSKTTQRVWNRQYISYILIKFTMGELVSLFLNLPVNNHIIYNTFLYYLCVLSNQELIITNSNFVI